MMYTLVQAATATGKAKSTIFKACKTGLVAVRKDEAGRFVIDPAIAARRDCLTSWYPGSERGGARRRRGRI
jgi:hypothetical protein